MKEIWWYTRLYLLFFFRVIMLRIYIECTFWITLILWGLVRKMFGMSAYELPPTEYVNLICFGAAVILAMQSTYIIDGMKGKIFSDKFGVDVPKLNNGEDK